MARLNDFISRIDLSAMNDYVMTHGTTVSYPKGTALVNQGERCRYAGVIKSGYFKFTVLNSKGNEVVAGFLFEGDVIMDYVRGFLRGAPAMTSIVAGSDAEILRVSIDNMRQYILEQPIDFVADASSHILQEAYTRYLDVLTKTPTERYRELMERCPGDINLLPVQELASYLRISRRQLHRIKEEI